MKEKIPKGRVNIAPLRKFASEQLPKNWPLREVLLAENDDEIDATTFLARLPLYLRLSKLKWSRE